MIELNQVEIARRANATKVGMPGDGVDTECTQYLRMFGKGWSRQSLTLADPGGAIEEKREPAWLD